MDLSPAHRHPANQWVLDVPSLFPLDNLLWFLYTASASSLCMDRSLFRTQSYQRRGLLSPVFFRTHKPYYRIGDDLTRFTTQCDPNPRLIRLFQHKRPQFIQFQYGRFWISSVRCDHCFAQCWQLFCFFFIHSMTEVRETPNVRSIPLKLLRSSYARSISSLRSSGYACGVGFSRLCLLQALQRYFCFPFGAFPFRTISSLPQCGQYTTVVTMLPSTSPTIVPLTLTQHSLSYHYPKW